MEPSEDEIHLARARLDDIREHVRTLAADAGTQVAWLRSCGWTAAEPFEHNPDHPPCVPVSELSAGYDDMWPLWRNVLDPLMTPAAAAALDMITETFSGFPEAAWVDLDATFQRPEWSRMRDIAKRVLVVLDAL